MAESYDIHLTDPLSAAFKVRAFTSNGTVFPTSSTFSTTAVGADTSLIIYGKGHPEYGERIGENIIHVMESFSGSTEPLNPVSGQSWFARYIVIRSDGTNFHLWTDDPLNLTNGGSWSALANPADITDGPLSSRPAVGGVTDGDYFFATDTGELYLAVTDSSSPLSPTWLLREFEDRTLGGAPAATDRPRKEMRIYNGGEWVSANQIHTSEVEPADQIEGELWYDTNIPQLKIHNGTGFVSTADLYLLLDGTSAMTGGLDMGNNIINNITDTASPSSAVTKNYVDTLTGALPTNLDDLADVTITTPVVAEVLKYVGPDWENVALLLTDFGMNASLLPAELDFSIGLSSNIQTQIDNFGTNTLKLDIGGGTMTGPIVLPSNPTINLHAATKQYVDSEIVTAITGFPDNVIASGSITQTTPTLEMTLVQKFVADPDVIVDISHGHVSSDVTHTSALSSLRDLNPGTYPTIDLSNLIENSANDVFTRLDNIDDFARRELFTASASDTDFEFTDGKYLVGSNRLNVYLNGIKQYANVRARQAIKFIAVTNISSTSLLGLAVDDYDLNIAVDGAATTNIVFSITGTSTIIDIINDINVALGTGATAAWNNADTSIQVFSSTTGTNSEIDITVGGAGADPDLLASLAAVTPGVELPVYETGNIFPANPTNVTTVTADQAYDEMVVVLTSGTQEVDVGGTRVVGSATGLANDATVYTAAIVVDGGASQPIAVTGSLAQDYLSLLSEITADLTGANAVLENGNILILSFSSGVTSTIAITDTDLFSTLTDYVAINAAVDGTRNVNAAPYGAESTIIQFNVAMAGGEVIEMISESVSNLL